MNSAREFTTTLDKLTTISHEDVIGVVCIALKA